jgi:hypothetical protein
MAGCMHRDLAAFSRRIDGVLAERAAVAEAEQALDEALAAHMTHIDPTTEGGPV